MRAFYAVFVTSVLAFFVFSPVYSADDFHEGFEYKKVVPPQPTQVEKGKIEVVEIFWYGCPHCYRFEPNLKKWLKNKPANVSFIKIPAQFYPIWALHAQAYYVAQILNIEDKIHTPFFEEIHKHKRSLNTREKVREFFKKFGVSQEKFDQAFDSFSVKNRLKQAKALVDKYQISGVPTLIVNGKYKASTSNVDGSNEKLIKLLNYLIKKESAQVTK